MKRILFLLVFVTIIISSCNLCKKHENKIADRPAVGQNEVPPNSAIIEASVVNIADDMLTVNVDAIKAKGQGYVAPLKSGDQLSLNLKSPVDFKKGQKVLLQILAQEQIGGTYSYVLTKIIK